MILKNLASKESWIMKKALLFIGGSAPETVDYQKELKEYDYAIAADSGYNLALRDSISLDLLVGDMDSISIEPDASVNTLVYPEDKDFTDTEIAISHIKALEEPHEIIMIGGGEGRLDHTFSLIALFKSTFPPVRWYTSFECLHFIKDKLYIDCIKGQGVSVLGLSDQPISVTSCGLQWELDKFPISIAQHSTSNRTTGNHLKISIERGGGVLIGISYH